jgi:uncharacterized membrane protein
MVRHGIRGVADGDRARKFRGLAEMVYGNLSGQDKTLRCKASFVTLRALYPSEVSQMAFCKACGAEVGGAAFCPKCGAGQGASAAPVASAPTASSEGLAENVAGLLCYVLGWLTGIIFLLIDKRPFVRFHAAQSIVVFGALTVIRIGFGIVMGIGGFVGFGLWALISMLLGLVGLILWILLMVKAYQHELFRVPIAAPIADGIAGK